MGGGRPRARVRAAQRLVRPRRGEAGYLLAAAMLLVALVSIMTAMAARSWASIGKREREAELKFRGQRIVRAILDWKREQPGGLQNPGLWPTLEQLTKPPKRYLASIPPDPMTAEYDESGELLEKTGVWQPIFMGPMQAGIGGQPPRPSMNPLPCEQKMPGWEKNRPIMGVYTCAEGTALTVFGGKEGLTYREWFFSALADNPNMAPARLLPDVIRCPAPECLNIP